MSQTNAYIPGLRAAVGHGLPGRPQRGGSGASAVGQIVIAAEPPPQGDWLPLDGSAGSDLLDAVGAPTGDYYLPFGPAIGSSGNTTLTTSAFAGDDSQYAAVYVAATKLLQLFRVGAGGYWELSGSQTLSDMPTGAITYAGSEASSLAIIPGRRQIAIGGLSGIRVYDINEGWSSATFKVAPTLPAGITSYYTSLKYTPDGKELVSLSTASRQSDGARIVLLSWAVDSNYSTPVATYLANTRAPYIVAPSLISADGKYVYVLYTYNATNNYYALVTFKRDGVCAYTKIGETPQTNLNTGTNSGLLQLSPDGSRLRVSSQSGSGDTFYTNTQAFAVGFDGVPNELGVRQAGARNLYGSNMPMSVDGSFLLGGGQSARTDANRAEVLSITYPLVAAIGCHSISTDRRYSMIQWSHSIQFGRLRRADIPSSDGKQTWIRVA